MGGGYAQSGLGLGPSLVPLLVDYTKILHHGTRALIEQAMIMAFEAMEILAGRYAKLAFLIQAYLENGGKHVQFNVVTRQTMLDARERPQEHRDLVVRIAGYSAYFVQLNDAMQQEVIDRTEHSLSAR